MPLFTVVMPVYNVEEFVAEAVRSVLNQTLTDFELLIIDDCSPDNSSEICAQFQDPRIQIIRHSINRGLAGARNTGIRHARGQYVAFLDSDDLWHPEKLSAHAVHLQNDPELGLSFSRSAFINPDGSPTRCFQMPQLKGFDAGYLFCRNPVGNGSAPVIRRQTLQDIAYTANYEGAEETCFFDASLRRSEDIECWTRIALKTSWKIEGLPQPLTRYRLNAGGLSASLYKQLESWEQVAANTAEYAPEFIAQWGNTARAYQLRYLARQAIRLEDGPAAVALLHRALGCHWKIAIQEPSRTLVTACAAYLLRLTPPLYRHLERAAVQVISQIQHRRINKEIISH